MEQGLYTVADLAAFPEDTIRREILGGELFVSASPLTRHQVVALRLGVLFSNHLDAEPRGAKVFMAPLDVVLSNRDSVQPDVFVVLDEQAEIITEKNIQGAPALLIEVLSEARMDRVRKRDLYARFRVPEYWIVDPDADRVEVYRLQEHGYGKPQILEPGDILDYAALPGFRVDIARLLQH